MVKIVGSCIIDYFSKLLSGESKPSTLPEYFLLALVPITGQSSVGGKNSCLFWLTFAELLCSSLLYFNGILQLISI